MAWITTTFENVEHNLNVLEPAIIQQVLLEVPVNQTLVYMHCTAYEEAWVVAWMFPKKFLQRVMTGRNCPTPHLHPPPQN